MSQKKAEFNKTEIIVIICMSSALGAGAVGGGVLVYEQNDATEQIQQSQMHRYPVKTEIALVEACRLQGIKDQWSYYAALHNKDRWERCTCALEQMQKSYSWEQYKKAGTANVKVLNNFLSACPVDQLNTSL